MIKQLFMLAMLAMLPALCTKRAQVLSYNLEEFTISTDDIMSLYVSGDYVVWTDMMNTGFYGYRPSAKEEFLISPNDVDSMSISMGGDFVVWRDMMNMDLYLEQVFALSFLECCHQHDIPVIRFGI